MFFVINCNFISMLKQRKSCDIYFMTGTGNSYQAAKQIAGLAIDSGYHTNINSCDEISRKKLRSNKHNELLIFSYPTHGFCLPWVKLKFILRFPKGKADVVLINNRAGMKLSKLFTPGISGIAVLLPMLILLLKGYRIKGVVPHDTPSNWISVHPGLRQKIIKSIFEKRDKELRKAWERLSVNKRYYPLKFFVLLPVDIFVAPISLGYIFFGRFMLARTFLADSRCDGCGICAARCPVQAIKMVNNRPWWTYKCESCMRCANICPKKAINSSIPLVVIYTIILFNISKYKPFSYFYDYLNASLDGVLQTLVYYAVQWIVTVIGCWLLYIVVFWINRTLLFNHLFAFTTPMRYWRRYIAPGFNGKYRKESD